MLQQTQSPIRSIGCELQPNLFDGLARLHETKFLSHIQVTIPNTIPFSRALEFSRQHSVIAHTNLLDLFGSNNWEELAPIARQIRALRPVHVVEHFTSFRPTEGEKTGVFFDAALTSKSSVDRIVSTVLKWQELTQSMICLENVAVSEDVDAYFDLLLEVRARTGCGIACDLPHYLLSLLSNQATCAQIQSLSQDLNPRQVHVGGLSIQNGELRDNHKIFSPWIADAALSLFPNASYVTLEQNHMVPLTAVEKQLIQIKEAQPCEFALPSLIGKGLAHKDVNDEIAEETARANNYPAAVRQRASQGYTVLQSPFDLYQKYLPFIFPQESVRAIFDLLDPGSALRAVAGFAKWSVSYMSWWAPDFHMHAELSYGEGENRLFSKRIELGSAVSVDLAAISQSESAHVIRFNSEKGFWVEVATQKFEKQLRREEEFYEQRSV